MTPASLTAFVTDSLSLKVAVYDDLGAPFILSDAKIEEATLVIGETPFSGTFKEESNLIDFFIPCELEQFNKPALLPFFVRISNPGNLTIFTIAYGTINFISPNIPTHA